MYPASHTVPSALNIIVQFAPAAISIASVISSFLVVPSSNITSAFILVGSVLFVVSSKPNCPLLFRPQVHTVPFPFNATKWYFPPAIFANALLPSPFTFTLTFATKSFLLSVNCIYVVPNPCAVIKPVLLTVAILVSKDLNDISLSINWFVSKLNPINLEYSICFWFPFTSKLITLFLLISNSDFCIHHDFTIFSVTSLPVSPFAPYPTVKTLPFEFITAPVCALVLFVNDAESTFPTFSNLCNLDLVVVFSVKFCA